MPLKVFLPTLYIYILLYYANIIFSPYFWNFTPHFSHFLPIFWGIFHIICSFLPTFYFFSLQKTRTNISACPSFSFIECYSVFNILMQRYYQGCIIFCYRLQKNHIYLLQEFLIGDSCSHFFIIIGILNNIFLTFVNQFIKTKKLWHYIL